MDATDEQTTAWKPMQDCRMITGDYSKQQLVDVIASMSPGQFNRFCQEILYLTHFYDTNRGAWVTDMRDHIEQNKAIFWPLPPIDFSRPVSFTIVE